jgi:hypothetical protein
MTSTTRPDSIRPFAAALAAGLVAVVACTEEIPSGPDDSQLPTAPVTVSLTLPFDQFASNLQVFGGYGLVDDLPAYIVANDYNGADARTLMRFGAFPRSAEVRDSLTRELRTDTLLTFVSAYVVIRLDTVASTNTGMVTMAFGQTLERWDPRTTTWSNAVDSVGGAVPWTQPGGGVVTPITTWDWDPTVTDSAQFFLDSTRIREWRSGTDSTRSGRIDLVTPGHRIKILGSALRVVAQPSINRDTVVVFTLTRTADTFIYDPVATPPADGIRVGGAPAWRTTLDIALPTTLNGPPTLCATVGCPFTLGPEHVTYAGLGLRSRNVPGAFHPTDTVSVEVRPVLDRGALPKAPLGGALSGIELGTAVPPELFGTGEGTLVDLPITRYVQIFLAGSDPSGRPPPTTLAIMSATEPETFTFGSFFGPGPTNAPVLNLVLTVSQPMEIQ